jgi:hypothetical protein
MTDHYAHVDTGEKKAAFEGTLRLNQPGATSGEASFRQLPLRTRQLGGEEQIPERKKPRITWAFRGAGEGT